MSLELQNTLAFGGLGGGGSGSGGVNDVLVDGTSVVTSGVASIDLTGKQDKTTVIDSSSATLSITLEDDTIYNNTAASLTSLDITLPGSPAADFISQVNFTSGSTATVLNAPNTIKWLGDDVTAGVFTPVADKRYALLIYYDGVSMRGISQAVA